MAPAVGVQWELPGALARRNWGHSVSFSARRGILTPPHRRAFWADGDLGSSNRPFSMEAPRSNGSARESSGSNVAGRREAALEPHRLHPPRPHPGSLKEGWHPDGCLRARWSETTGHWRSGDGGERTGFELSTIALR